MAMTRAIRSKHNSLTEDKIMHIVNSIIVHFKHHGKRSTNMDIWFAFLVEIVYYQSWKVALHQIVQDT